ncbi:ribonuclease H-like domain-containing protein [Methanobrevibacter sp.]|uniref:ribonuclease H-like domain-containing protein n=1 Tax=Methanobrevibacter sp. TaxID=66852 RepID=UPI0038901C12
MYNEKQENYYQKMLANSISSRNPSNEAKQRAREKSPLYFEDLKRRLLADFEGKNLSDIENSEVVSTDLGETLKITNKEKINFKIEDNNFKDQINHNLKLLPKIGIKKEETLKNNGYSTIESLKTHNNYGDMASKFLDRIDEMAFCEIMDLLDRNKYSKKCRDNLLKCISLTDCENFKFMDIETKGLSNVPIILIGVAEIKGNKIISSQYFLRNYAEEDAILDAYLSHLDEDSIHVTFNGKSFDVPFIKNRCTYNRISANLDLPHLDLMYFAKNLWSDDLPNCKLQTIEKEFFGLERQDDVPGQYIPGYYDAYLSQNNIGPIVPIIEHNRQDIVSLAAFLEKMYRDVN